MKQKNFDSDVIPAEQVVLLEKHILEELKKLRADSVEEMKNVRTESERKIKLLAEYQATPMEVVEIDSLWDIINPDTIVRNFDERLRPLKESDKSMAALLNKIDNRTGRIDNGLDNQYSLIEGLDSYITKPSRRRRFFEFVWKNRYNIIYDVAVALLSLVAILWTLYESRWSDDAWARRAYDAAVILEFKDKEIVYHSVRQDFANVSIRRNAYCSLARAGLPLQKIEAYDDTRRNRCNRSGMRGAAHQPTGVSGKTRNSQASVLQVET